MAITKEDEVPARYRTINPGLAIDGVTDSLIQELPAGDLNEYAPHIYYPTARSHDPGIAPENRTSVPGVPRTD